ncbi:hypothetical protein L484_008178 [Morus notabilis]|uniref:Uncharacterized protein n=1 Tax=Morus notabilis TaxID=981085 RepID=W9RPV1_9ROSA|nr:hypothetical protein L484_008178 [Morus notabilis]
MVEVLAKTLSETDLKNSFPVPTDWLPVLPPLGQGHTNKMVQQLWVAYRLGYFWEFLYLMSPVEYYPIDGVNYYARSQSYLYAEEWLKASNLCFLKDSKLGIELFLTKERTSLEGQPV